MNDTTRRRLRDPRAPGLLVHAAVAAWRLLPFSLRRVATLLRGGHYTATVAAVLLDEHGRMLLLEHRFRDATSRWAPPGGIVARGEQPEDALRREVREEAGLEVERCEVAFVRTFAGYPHIEIVFRGGASGEPVADGFEISDARWVPLAEVAAGVHPQYQELISRALGQSPQSRY